MRIFVSYSSRNRPQVKALVQDLENTGHDVWYDQEAAGGHEWWADILENIRACELFIFALTPESLDSEACRREYRYAHALHKRILPVRLNKAVNPASLTTELQKINFVDYFSGAEQEYRQLVRAITSLKPPVPMPEPMPDEPPVPISPLGELREQIAARSIGVETQTYLVFELKQHVEKAATRAEALELLQRLQNHPSVLAKVANEITTTITPYAHQSPTTERADRVGASRRFVAGGLVGLVAIVVVVGLVILLGGGDEGDRRTQADAETQTPSPTTANGGNLPSNETATLTATGTVEQATHTLSVDERAQATANAVATLNEDYRRATASEQAIRDSHDTATAFPLTQAAQETLDAIAVGTRVVELQATQITWTPTPTITFTPSRTPTSTQTATSTPSSTSTSTPTATLSPIELAETRVAHNNDWVIYSELDSKGVEMVLVPAGCFMMGSEDGESDERPVREQCIDEPFWIDKYEVTNEQYGSVGCSQYSSEPDQPRNCISWFDARDYCESRGARLPTEREWEYAARGPDNLVYPWGDTYEAAFVIGADDPTYGDTKTAPVGSRLISWVGALDMSGNLWEWTSTLYGDYPYVETDGREDLTSTYLRVLRGGSFNLTSFGLRVANRRYSNPDVEANFFGFRCVRSIN